MGNTMDAAITTRRSAGPRLLAVLATMAMITGLVAVPSQADEAETDLPASTLPALLAFEATGSDESGEDDAPGDDTTDLPDEGTDESSDLPGELLAAATDDPGEQAVVWAIVAERLGEGVLHAAQGPAGPALERAMAKYAAAMTRLETTMALRDERRDERDAERAERLAEIFERRTSALVTQDDEIDRTTGRPHDAGNAASSLRERLAAARGGPEGVGATNGRPDAGGADGADQRRAGKGGPGSAGGPGTAGGPRG